MSPRRAPGVYPVQATMGVQGAERYEVELPDGTVENVTAETLATPEYSAKVRQALQRGGVQGYSAVSRTPVLEREPPGTDLTGSSGTAIAIGEPQITNRVPRDIRVSQGAPGMPMRPFESLAAYAPQAENLPPGAPNSAGNAPQMMADSGGIPGTVQRLAMGGAAPDGLHPALAPLRDEGLKLAQRAARERSLLANLARAGGMMIGRGGDAAYATLDRSAGQPVEDYLQQQQLDSQATAAEARQAEATRRAGLEEREMAVKERPKPGMTAEEKAFRDRELKADEMRARAAMISAQRPQGPSPAQEFRQAQADERDIQKLGKDTEEMAALAPDMQRLLSAAGQEGDIAGAGILGSRAPGFLLDQEGIQNRQAAMRVASALLREVSGAAVTPQEAERFMEGRGLGPGATEAQFRAGAKALASELAGRLQAKQAKYRPGLVDTLRSRGGFTADQLPGTGAAPSQAPMVRSEQEYNSLPPGTVYVGPDGKKRRKL